MSTRTHNPNSFRIHFGSTARHSVAILISLCLLALFGAAETFACPDQAAAVPLVAGESWTETTAEAMCFEVTVADPGLLAVEIVQPARAPRVFLSLSATDVDAGFRVVRHAGQLMLLDAAPGRYGFSVSPVGLGGEFGGEGKVAGQGSPFRLRTRWLAQTSTKDEHDSEIEIEPENKDEHDSEIEIEPEFLTMPGKVPADLTSVSELTDNVRAELCGATIATEIDGASGSLLCATAVRGDAETRGELAATRDDEAHAYRFETTAVGPVAISVAADRRGGELTVELLDRFGQRLGSWIAGSRTRRVLVPGTYFVRIQSAYGDPSGYQLLIEGPAIGDAAER